MCATEPTPPKTREGNPFMREAAKGAIEVLGSRTKGASRMPDSNWDSLQDAWLRNDLGQLNKTG